MTMTGQSNPITVGVLFQKKADLKKIWQNLATRENFEYAIVKSDKSRMTIKCLGEGCQRPLHASKVGDTENGNFAIKMMCHEHICLGVQHLSHRQVLAKFIADRIQGKIRDHSSYRPKEIRQDMRR